MIEIYLSLVEDEKTSTVCKTSLPRFKRFQALMRLPQEKRLAPILALVLVQPLSPPAHLVIFCGNPDRLDS